MENAEKLGTVTSSGGTEVARVKGLLLAIEVEFVEAENGDRREMWEAVEDLAARLRTVVVCGTNGGEK